MSSDHMRHHSPSLLDLLVPTTAITVDAVAYGPPLPSRIWCWPALRSLYANYLSFSVHCQAKHSSARRDAIWERRCPTHDEVRWSSRRMETLLSALHMLVLQENGNPCECICCTWSGPPSLLMKAGRGSSARATRIPTRWRKINGSFASSRQSLLFCIALVPAFLLTFKELFLISPFW